MILHLPNGMKAEGTMEEIMAYSESLKIHKPSRNTSKAGERKIGKCETCGKSFIYVSEGTKNCRPCRTRLGHQKKSQSVDVVQPKAWDVEEAAYSEL